MPFPIAGAVIGGGAALLGGALADEAAEDRLHSSQQFSRESEARNEALQREFAQHGIRWRVEDAKAAGLHPLYALGGSGASFTPSAITVGGDSGGHLARAVADAGQHLGRAVSATESADQRAFRLLQMRGAEAAAERDFAQAAYWRAEAARKSQGDLGSAPFPADVVTGAYSGVQTQAVDIPGRTRVEMHPLYTDAVKLSPDEMASRDVMHVGQTAGRNHPGLRQFQLPGDFRVLLPATQGGGVPEDIDLSLLPFVVGANIQRYGVRWLVDAVNYVTGATPAETRAQDRAVIRFLRRALPPFIGD